MKSTRWMMSLLVLSVALALSVPAHAKGKPTPPPPSGCSDIAATMTIENLTGLSSDQAGQSGSYDAVIYACNTGDARLDTGNSRTVGISLSPASGAPGWMNGQHIGSINIKRLLHNTAEPGVLFSSLSQIEKDYTFTTVMIIRPDAYDTYPIWFHNPNADALYCGCDPTVDSNCSCLNNTAPAGVDLSNTALVQVTHTALNGTHTWTVVPVLGGVPDNTAVQTYTVRDKRTVKNMSAGTFSLPFKITITAQE